MWSVGAAGVMAFRHRPPAAAAVAALSVAAYAYAATWEGWGSSYRDGWSEGAVSVVTAVVVGAIVLIGLYASARMVAVIGALEGARDELVQDAAATVRQEIFRDLHDVLGQRLTAITLKTELARHFVLIDPARASAELTDVVEIACLLSHEVSQVNRGVRQATLSRELQDSIALLQVAGVTVRVRVATDGVDADSGALLAWAVREGATNIVRHTSAQRCDIAVRHEPNRLVFEMTNDGAAGSGLYGTGLAGLAARFSAAGGTVIAERGPRGKFRLEAALPTRLQPTGVTGDADGVESIAGA